MAEIRMILGGKVEVQTKEKQPRKQKTMEEREGGRPSTHWRKRQHENEGQKTGS